MEYTSDEYKAGFTYGLVWAAAQGHKTRGVPSSKMWVFFIMDTGAQTYVMKGPQILLAQGSLKA